MLRGLEPLGQNIGGTMVMRGHKFHIGERVRFVPAFHQKAGMVTNFEIVRQLPDLNGEFFYRIKSTDEPHERVVGESQLSMAQVEAVASPVTAAAKPAKAAIKPKSKARPKSARPAK